MRVHAAGVNPADWKIRSGTVRKFGAPPFTLGLDLRGVVEAVGEQVTRFRTGDEVYGCAFPPHGASDGQRAPRGPRRRRRPGRGRR